MYSLNFLALLNRSSLVYWSEPVFVLVLTRGCCGNECLSVSDFMIPQGEADQISILFTFKGALFSVLIITFFFLPIKYLIKFVYAYMCWSFKRIFKVAWRDFLFNFLVFLKMHHDFLNSPPLLDFAPIIMSKFDRLVWLFHIWKT